MYGYICTYTQLHISECIFAIYVYIYIHTHTHTHVNTGSHLHKYMLAYTHECVHLFSARMWLTRIYIHVAYKLYKHMHAQLNV